MEECSLKEYVCFLLPEAKRHHPLRDILAIFSISLIQESQAQLLIVNLNKIKWNKTSLHVFKNRLDTTLFPWSCRAESAFTLTYNKHTTHISASSFCFLLGLYILSSLSMNPEIQCNLCLRQDLVIGKLNLFHFSHVHSEGGKYSKTSKIHSKKLSD